MTWSRPCVYMYICRYIYITRSLQYLHVYTNAQSSRVHTHTATGRVIYTYHVFAVIIFIIRVHLDPLHTYIYKRYTRFNKLMNLHALSCVYVWRGPTRNLASFVCTCAQMDSKQRAQVCVCVCKVEW